MLTDDEIYAVAYEAYNEDAGPNSPDNNFRRHVMENLRPVFVLFARKLLGHRSLDAD